MRTVSPKSNSEKWEKFLSSLETDLVRAANMHDGGNVLWEPPTDLGPLPEELVGRVQRLVKAQQIVTTGFVEEQQSVREHLHAISVIPEQSTKTPPIYLDTKG